MEFDKIAAFVRRHHVMTLATVGSEGWPWCAHVFYAWMPAGKMPGADGVSVADGQSGCFVFTTDTETRHGTEMSAGSRVEAGVRVAAGIALETRIVGRVQGLQMEGEVRRAEGDDFERARKAYLKRFPYAAVVELQLWVLEPTLMKLTDNTLGFGKKLVWEK